MLLFNGSTVHRNVSAEIFVVCRDFLAPKHIDPRFLDPKHVFKDLSSTGDKGADTNNYEANVFRPEKKRRNRDGYADGDYTLFKAANVVDFIRNPDPIAMLGSVNKIAFETEEEKGYVCFSIFSKYFSYYLRWHKLDITTADVISNCADLKVLGKGDFKALIRWRLALREEVRPLSFWY